MNPLDFQLENQQGYRLQSEQAMESPLALVKDYQLERETDYQLEQVMVNRLALEQVLEQVRVLENQQSV